MGEILLVRPGVGCKWRSTGEFILTNVGVSERKTEKAALMKKVFYLSH